MAREKTSLAGDKENENGEESTSFPLGADQDRNIILIGREVDVRDLSEESLRKLKSDFLLNIANNNNRVLEIVSVPVNDKVKVIKITTAKVYSLNEIEVEDIDFRTMRGHVKINKGAFLPLFPMTLNTEGPRYRYNKDETIDEINTLNKIELGLIEEETRKAEETFTECRKMKAFMNDVVEKKLY